MCCNMYKAYQIYGKNCIYQNGGMDMGFFFRKNDGVEVMNKVIFLSLPFLVIPTSYLSWGLLILSS